MSTRPEEWEAELARHILQSCRVLLTELESIKLNVQGGTIRDLCSAEWAATEAHMGDMLQALRSDTSTVQSHKQLKQAPVVPLGNGQLVQASRQTVGALRTCVQRLAGSPALEAADGPSLRATTMALHAVAVGIKQLHATCRAAEPKPDSLSTKLETSHAKSTSESGTASSCIQSQPASVEDECARVVDDALQAAAALAELLRIFTRVSQQSWAATRSQLAHAPSVPSPLASGSSSALRHRRWVSEEIDAELPSAPGLQISVDGRPFGAEARRQSESSSHSRNRSDSRIHFGPNIRPGGPLPRKSALSLRRPSQQLGTPLVGGNPEPAERSKQVRFITAVPNDQPVDQAHLNELTQLLSLFEKAIAALQAVSRRGADAETNTTSVRSQTIRSLAAAFLQLSRLSSSTGLVRHYDKPTLAQFKATTQAVKLLMPLCPKP
ncbi:hypothetical protein H4S07_005664 [Coemansia furcata]|uniref:Uncharacterized protein n=1 Tax=Coemansia furcata TaxID=417177 RepID=A0ACC1KZV3_9FUNG|nr:hypothetical protein H4S07_005664 [Coemansia furcata]